ncbi:MAG: AMP-binding protein, partial [Acidobacteria bacterium]|nr:AMP-binding protein [Acidobacteriota bacterium]
VLGVGRLGIDDDFFELGGHSLLATRLISRIRASLGVELPIRSLFEAPSVAGLAQRLTGAQAARPPLQPLERPAEIPLSFAQRRLWFLHRLEGPSPTYNIPVGLRLRGALDQAALEAALADVVARHESLRTIFPERDGVPCQRILRTEEARLRLKITTQTLSEAALPEALRAAARWGFDLSAELPLRAELFRLSPEEHVLVLVLHHIASDGWSLGPLARDLGRAYAARCRGEEPRWAPLPVQYADYSLWQQQLLGSEADPQSPIGRQIAFWTQALAGLPEQLALPTDRPRPAVATYRGGSVPLRVGPELHGRLLGLARERQATLFMVLQAGLAALLSRLGAGTDVPLGSPIAGRTDHALEELVGFFVNTLVLRTDTSGEPSFGELLARVRATDLAAYAHQDLAFERLVELLNPARSLSRHPLFQVMLALQNAPEADLQLPGLAVTPEPVGTDTAKFDLWFSVAERRGADGKPAGLEGLIEYRADLFERGTVEALAQRLVRLLEAAAAEPDRPIGRLDILGPEERRRLLLGWNDTACEVPATTLAALFEAQAARNPEATAVVFERQALSYGELNGRANRLAHHLLGLGVGPERLVGVALERSAELVVALLAVLKAGGAYLPLDPDYPPERLAAMCQDARPACVLTTAQVASRLPDPPPCLLLEHPGTAEALSQQPETNPSEAQAAQPLRPEHPAYVIYTSGSTGRPKGVVVSQGSLNNFLAAMQERFRLEPHDRLLAVTTVGFDIAALELFLPLLSGARLILAPRQSVQYPPALARLIKASGATVLQAT